MSDSALETVKALVGDERFRVTQHAQQEMVDEDIRLDDVLEAIQDGTMLEHYPDHRRGACGLVCGQTLAGRALHVVCSTELPMIVLITVYEPRPPKWPTPTQRRERP